MIDCDGTHLKGKARGILLTALSMDADECLYPLAFALVEIENTHHWKWFIECLKTSLDLEDGSRITMMSDMQKVMHCVSKHCLFFPIL